MSAIPKPRGPAAPGGRPRPPLNIAPCDDAGFFGLIPAGPVARADLSDRAVRILAGLCVLARGSRTWVRATVPELMLATGKSEKTVRQGLRELTGAGVIEWDSIGGQFRVLFRLRGPGERGPAADAPRIAAAETDKPVPIWEPEREPDPEPERVAIVPPLGSPFKERGERERDDERPAGVPAGEAESSSSDGSPHQGTGTTEADVHEPDYHPTAPLDECADQATEDELHESFAQRVIDLVGACNRRQLRDDIREFGESMVDHAIRIAEGRHTPPDTYAFIRRTLENMRAEGTDVGPRKTRSERHSRPTYREAYPPEAPARPSDADVADMIRQAREGDVFSRRLHRAALRGMVKAGVLPAADVPGDVLGDPTPGGERTPAAGSHANVPPPPGREISMPPVESYRPPEGPSNPTGEHRTPHDAGQFASLPHPAESASNQAFPGIRDALMSPPDPPLSHTSTREKIGPPASDAAPPPWPRPRRMRC